MQQATRKLVAFLLAGTGRDTRGRISRLESMLREKPMARSAVRLARFRYRNTSYGLRFVASRGG
ncbi:hypothetical protein DB347_23295 [Opitutaceae bacterium EW11]|nr:hypothetical protein DB347_23295 [Opitutaceae bacterium EW11]